MAGLTIERILRRRRTFGSSATLPLGTTVDVSRCIPMVITTSSGNTAASSDICTLRENEIEVGNPLDNQDISVIEFSDNVQVYVKEGVVTTSLDIDLSVEFGIEESEVTTVFPFISGPHKSIGRTSSVSGFSENFMLHKISSPRGSVSGSSAYKVYFAVGFR